MYCPYNSNFVWATWTQSSGSAPYTLDMQTDGNLVLYGNGDPLWSSDTSELGTAGDPIDYEL